ncbi:hypothetical protein NMG60_11001406 [Bertholletia excelsa]
MEKRVKSIISQLVYTAFCILLCATTGVGAVQELLRGFAVKPNPSVSAFQALLSDSSGNYSLGLLRVNRTLLDLAVVHVPSSEQVWIARTSSRARWSEPTRIFFNGSLVVSDPHTGVFWSTSTEGDRVWLSNTSNLQIQKLDETQSVESVVWQSFSFPYDTLVENQNFTSTMSLVSSNGLYSMRLGSNFIGLYAKFNPGSDSDQMYWKHKALEAKANINEGQGPVYLILSAGGFLGMYQNGSNIPVDVQSFSSFQQRGSGIRRVLVEPDGNLKGYYWTGSSWVLDYKPISEPCELPSPCGSYGLCNPGKGCSCLDNGTDYTSSGCHLPGEKISGDFCGSSESKYRILRREGVELPFKELMGYSKMESLAQCEEACEENCTCWGAVYSNSSGFCYTLSYPIQTLRSVADETKVGYFKVREGARRKVEAGLGVGIGLLCGAVLIFGLAIGFGLYRLRKRKSGVKGYVEEEDGVIAGPYKNLGTSSFKSIELCER